MKFFSELQRRNVFRVAGAYAVTSWALTEITSTLLEIFTAPEWVGQALVLVLAIGFIPVVVFSWVFEVTPEGIRREAQLAREGRRDNTTAARRLDIITIGAVVLGIAFVGWTRFGSDLPLPRSASSGDPRATMAAPSGVPSIAVVPFVNMSRSSDNEYFSDGLTETLINMLARTPGLRVAARTSSFSFKHRETEVEAIADALRVEHLLVGSVQRAGNRIRVTAQLVRAADGTTLWSASHDRTVDDIFRIQDEIAGEVGRELSASLLDGAPGGAPRSVATRNVDAYDNYLQALEAQARGSYEGLREAERLLKAALARDPGFQDAKTLLAANYMDQITTGLRDAGRVDENIALLEQVLAEHPEDVQARAQLIYARAYRSFHQSDVGVIPAAIEEFEALIASAPNEVAPRLMVSDILRGFDRNAEALAHLRAARELDVLNPVIHLDIGRAYIGLELWSEAREALEQSLSLEPQQPNALLALASIARQTGDGLAYASNYLDAAAIDPEDHELPGVVAEFLYELDLVAQADRLRERVDAIAPTSPMARKLDLLRTIAREPGPLSEAVARRMIEDGVNNRQGAWLAAVRHLLRSGTSSQEAAAQVVSFVARHVEDFDRIEEAAPYSTMQARQAAFGVWRLLLPEDELRRRIELVTSMMASIGFPLADAPERHVEVLALRGQEKLAVDVALNDLFTEPSIQHPGWRRFFALPHLTSVVSDPRIEEAMARWERDEETLRERLRGYLLEQSVAFQTAPGAPRN